MAQYKTGQKKGWLYRVMMGKDDLPDFEEAKLPGNRWQVFKDIFAHQFGKLVKINLLVLLFCLPAIAWMIYCYITGMLTAANINYTGNIGFGFAATSSAVLAGNVSSLQLAILEYGVLIPLLMIAGIGFSGAFYTYKLMIWQDGVMVAHTFFKGIKENILHFLWTSLILGAGLMLLMFNIVSLDMQTNTAIAILSIIASSLLLLIILFMALFMWTQTVTYKMKFWQLVKNSFLFSIGMLLQNIIFVAISLIPIILIAFLPFTFALMLLVLYALFGFSFTFLIWTIYAHYCFDKTINNYTPGAIKDRGIRRISPEEVDAKRKEAAERRRKASNVRYANPKKGKKTAELTPLSTTFSRKELERLEEEKRAIAQEIQDETEIDGVSASEQKDANPNESED